MYIKTDGNNYRINIFPACFSFMHLTIVQILSNDFNLITWLFSILEVPPFVLIYIFQHRITIDYPLLYNSKFGSFLQVNSNVSQ